MKQKLLLSFGLITACLSATAQTNRNITVENKSKMELKAQPVVFNLKPYKGTKTALVTLDGKEIPCQLDDLDGDRQPDELFFLTD